jgi:hypothetical protein
MFRSKFCFHLQAILPHVEGETEAKVICKQVNFFFNPEGLGVMFLRNIGYMATRLNSDLFYKAVQFVSVIYVTKNTCCYIFTFGVDLLQVAFENSVLRY